MRPKSRDTMRAGFTLVEAMIVVAIIGILTALAIPATGAWLSARRLAEAGRGAASAFSFARSEAVRTGNIHVVYWGSDPAGNNLIGPDGNQVDLLVTNDGLPGALLQNCAIDAGEARLGYSASNEVNPGLTGATVKVPDDGGNGPFALGTSFQDAALVNPATWVLFRPEGTPRSFSLGCATGAIGSGAGGLYLTNGDRDIAVVVTQLGASRVYGWNPSAGGWSN